jgi:uncharacterized membrane protein YgaE (UPF0421/DUF939 family)
MELARLRAEAEAFVHARWLRLRSAWWTIVQTAAAAAIAYELAGLIPGHSMPVFAPVAAIIALTANVGRRGRQALELVGGITIGIGLAELLVLVTGSGAWQIAVAVAAGMTLTNVLGLPPLVLTQAAVWGVLVVTLPQPNLAASRFVDGLIGAAVALVFTQLLFPADPRRLVAGAARPFYGELADILATLSEAVGALDEEQAREALARAERLDERRLREAIETARGIVRRAPARRRSRGWLEPYVQAASELDRIERDVVVLAVGVVRMLDTGESPPATLDHALGELAEALRRLPESLAAEDDDVPERTVSARDRGDRALEESDGLGSAIVRQQLHLLARDVLEALDSQPAAEASRSPAERR